MMKINRRRRLQAVAFLAALLVGFATLEPEHVFGILFCVAVWWYRRNQPVVQQAEQTDRHTKADQGGALLSGEVIDLGSAPYQHDDRNSESYFITLRIRQGREKTVWGVDLQRVAEEQAIQPGDCVSLFKEGQKPVVIKKEVRDESGAKVGTRQVTTHRNAWKATVMSRCYSA